MFVLLMTLASAAAAQQPSVPAEPMVVASGQGVVLAVPDRAWITISAESRAPSPREAQRLNAEAMRPVQDKLRAAGIPAEAIRTTRLRRAVRVGLREQQASGPRICGAEHD